MTQTLTSIMGQRTPMMTAAAALVAAACLTAWTLPAAAQGAPGADLQMEELEKAFWSCDHAATTGLLDIGTAIACASLTETLKVRKFAGDFDAMLAWWRLHKDAKHLALEKAERNAVARLAPIHRH